MNNLHITTRYQVIIIDDGCDITKYLKNDFSLEPEEFNIADKTLGVNFKYPSIFGWSGNYAHYCKIRIFQDDELQGKFDIYTSYTGRKNLKFSVTIMDAITRLPNSLIRHEFTNTDLDQIGTLMLLNGFPKLRSCD